MFTRKMRRQPPAASSRPPTDGPRASPSAWAAPWKPSERPRRDTGTARAMMATLLAWSMAAPMACRARKPSRASRFGALAHRAEPAMKMANP